VQAAVDSGLVDSGDTVVVLVGMMTELEGASTTNTLKVHVAAETLVTGRSVVDGRTTGRAFRTADGDLADAPAVAVVLLEPGFDGEFDGDLSKLAAVVSADSGLTGYPAVVARELGLPMVGNADVDAVADGDRVTVDGERGVVYRADQ
jgi:pyruvate kinase